MTPAGIAVLLWNLRLGDLVASEMGFRSCVLLLVTLTSTAFGPVWQAEEVGSRMQTTAPKPFLVGWTAETFSLPPEFAPTMPKGTESLRFAPGWRSPEKEDYWSYAFVMWIDERVPDKGRISTLLESYYNGLLTAFAQGDGQDISATPVQIDIAQSFPGQFKANMRAADAFGTYKPITVHFEIKSVSLGSKRSSLHVKVSTQPKEHAIWKSLEAAIDDILAKNSIDMPPQEREAVESAIRRHLNLSEGSPIDAAVLAKVTKLDLSQQPISDASLRWMSNPTTGFSALAELNLQGTQVTDAGIAALASANTGMKKLNTLMLASTSVTDVGLSTVSKSKSGLKNLTTLDLRSTLVTENGIIALSRPDTGLQKLTTLDLSFTKVTDNAIEHLSRSDSGLKRLRTLGLASTQVSDSSLINLSKKQTGLKALRVLNLAFTGITDVGLQAASAPDTGLSKLSSLFLYGTRLTDSGVREVARTNSGLKALTLLDIGQTSLTDIGLIELARPTSGLKSLSKLHIRDTKVTDNGVGQLRKKKPKLDVTR